MSHLWNLVDTSNAGYSNRFTKPFLDEMVHVADPISDRAIVSIHEAAYNPDGGQIDHLRRLADGGDDAATAFFERANHRPPRPVRPPEMPITQS